MTPLSGPPTTPDGTYTTWKGRTRPALSPSFRRKAALIAPDPGETAPPTYERAWGEGKAFYVPFSELTELYTLRTTCTFEGRTCPVETWTTPDRIRIGITGINEQRATALGLTPTLDRGQWVTELPITQVNDLQQTRHDLLPTTPG